VRDLERSQRFYETYFDFREHVPRPLIDEEDLVSARVLDPDGHTIEIYWE
jgi:catechol 2,3-dioxygenase-like lactoylglutathione lyase family enzyme